MNRQHVRKITIREFDRLPGWYFQKTKGGHISNVMVAFRSPGKSTGYLTDHSISESGEVDGSVSCECSNYHEYVIILDDWPTTHSKQAFEPNVKTQDG